MHRRASRGAGAAAANGAEAAEDRGHGGHSGTSRLGSRVHLIHSTFTLPLAPIAAAVTAVLLLLPSCAPTGDFGRPKPMFWSEMAVPIWVQPAVQVSPGPVAPLPLTDLETELRNRAWRFLVPAEDRVALDVRLADAVRTRTLPPPAAEAVDTSAYYRGIMAGPFRSPASRYRRIVVDAGADTVLIGPFRRTAEEVFEADRVRLEALLFVRDLTEAQAYAAAARTAENRCLVAWVAREVAFRESAYRYAVQHLFVSAPQSQAVEAEQAVRALEHHRQALDALARAGATCRSEAAVVVGVPRPFASGEAIVVKD